MASLILSIVIAIVLFTFLQMIIPFPFGLVIGLVMTILVVGYALRHPSPRKHSILNYRRVDPINEKERLQNEEALRILEKKYIEEKISKEEYLQRKKEFEDIEYNPRKCKVCGSEEFKFISEEHVEEPGEYTSDVGYYKCKRCGAK
ncbi:hypothetical protein [Nitrosopumilus ureiphilus]|uniref:Uncharacterized protein n=1 Tax=Nitrosopumilus ureiphilus TaxID=1470067 RepID=A0A7D5M315_9ARCH|nr:hypothetical protein [Nitrosopumilus ureiphilus]QLH05834.1 hypothetical protein C5F50_01115 [Nitrosopumilus ureiphilus]